MAIEIRETIVTPKDAEHVVQLHISDVAPGDEAATFRLLLSVQIQRSETDQLSVIQRDALREAHAAIRHLLGYD